ncbi:MAG: hypothetical protein WKF47_16385 [Geodermatophilaceae bacterium]
MAMGHVVLKEFFVDRQTPYFTEYVKTYTDLPLPGPPRRAAPRRRRLTSPAGQVPHRRRPAALTTPRRTPPSRRCCSTRAPASRWCRTARSGHRYGDSGVGQVEPRSRRRRPAAVRCSTTPSRPVLVALPRFDTPDGAGRRPAPRRAGAAGRRPPGHHRLRPAAGAVRRRPRRAARGSGRPATTTPTRRTPRPGRRRSPASRPQAAARIGREFAAQRRGVARAGR